ncbi:MAG: hypothetical protein ACFFCM_15905 [Promethearchaeota archaeon]
MKKLLIIILVGFIVVSILTIMFTIQNINTFTFEDDNGDNNDDNLIMMNLNLFDNKFEIQQPHLFSEYMENFLIDLFYRKGLESFLCFIFL